MHLYHHGLRAALNPRFPPEGDLWDLTDVLGPSLGTSQRAVGQSWDG